MSNKDSMITLSTKEQCREKIHVWFGSKSNHIHTCVEAIINSNDEIVNNFPSGVITVSLSDDCKKMSVEDTGRGIRLGDVTNDVPNYKLYFETLFSSTNYRNIKSKKITGGTNGVANVVIAQTSSLFVADSWYEGTHYKITYIEGDLSGGLVRTTCDINKHGTKFTFVSSDEVYTTNVFNVGAVKELCNNLAGISNTIKVIFKHKEEETVFEYARYEDYMDEIEINKISSQISFNEMEFIEDTGERNSIKCTLSLSTTPIQKTFLNYIYLKEHGTIYDGVIAGLRRVFQKDINNKKIKLSSQDIEMSFNVLCTVMSNNVEYASQMKFSTAKQLYRKLASEYIIGNMEVFKAENPQEFDKILKHLEQINVLNTKNEKIIKDIKKKLNEKATSATSRPLKLIPCRSKNPKEVELILIEGDSAMTSVKASRNPNTMMILPLKGKPINALKQSLERLLGNQEILDIFKILECGVTYKGKNVKGFDKFDINKLAVNKVLIATAFDDVGFHIQSLLIGVFYILAPQLLSHGVIEFIQTPLYLIKTKNETFKAYSENERQRIISNLNCKYSEVRFKGIGGLPVKVMKEALSMDTRISYKITMNDAKKCADKIELFLSDNVEARKKYIEENGDKFVNETLFI